MCVNGTKTIGKQVDKLLATIELASILANFFTNLFVLLNAYLTCERLANMCWSTFIEAVHNCCSGRFIYSLQRY